MNTQSELDFETNGNGRGYSQWLARRRVAVEELARRINLPLGHDVEVWLHGGIRLRGRLLLKEEMLFIEEEKLPHMQLAVERVGFSYQEMESCVRVD